MRSVGIPYSLVLVGLVLTASLVVLGQTEDNCSIILNDCKKCVTTKNIVVITNTTDGGANGTCIWEVTTTGQKCTNLFRPAEGTTNAVFTEDGCDHLRPSTPSPDPPETTTTQKPTTPTPTNGTTTTPVTTVAPSTNGTTTTASTTTAGTTTTAPTNVTTTTTTTTSTPATPTNGTTPATTPTPSSSTAAPSPKPTPAPKSGGFSWGSFIGGIVFAAALSSLAYLIFRFYKVRLDRNYHTLNTNLI